MSTNLFDAEGMTKSERKLHTPSGFARKHLIYIQEVGRLKSLKAHSSIRENLESFLVFLVLDGEGSVTYQGNTYPVKKGELVFLDCRLRYEHTSSVEHPWELLWAHFNGELPKSYYPLFLEKNDNTPVICPKEGLAAFQDIIERLMERQRERMLLNEMETSQDLSSLLLLCMKEVMEGKEEVGNPSDEELRREDYEGIREYINEHFGDEGLKSGLAIQYGIELKVLKKAFKEKYGISLEDYIENRKFNKAKELLRFTIKPIEEIVAESGIGNEEEFRRLFMENEEMTPEEYRRKWAQWIKG